MSVLSNPARAQFLRLRLPGETPGVGQPGSFAVNLVDRRAWTFDDVGDPVPIAYDMGDHDPSRFYAAGQLVVRDGALWRANTNLAPGAFNPANWAPIATDGIFPPAEPANSGVTSGGVLSLVGGDVSVTSGSGVIVDATNPTTPTRAQVSWGAQSATLTAGGEAARLVAINAAGVLVSLSLGNTPAARRQHIVLGYAEFDALGALTRVANLPRVGRQVAEDVGDLVEAIGGAFILQGASIFADGGLMLAQSAGQVYAPQARWRAAPTRPNEVVVGATAITFDVKRLSGEIVSAAAINVPTDAYELGALPIGFSAVHFLFCAVDGSYRWLQLGFDAYPSLAQAIAALQTEWASLPLSLRQRPDAFCAGAVVVTRGSTVDLAGRVFPAQPGPQLNLAFSVGQSATGFLRTDGLNAMQGSLDLAGNSVQNAIIDEGVF
jgi:hypothetical protein